MRLIVIASGSSANAAVIENNGAAVLVDCGVTLKTLKCGLAKAGLSLSDLCAAFITHRHSDHIKGLPVLARAADIPIYSAVDIGLCSRFEDKMTLSGFEVQAFECSHDVPCVGYKISCGDKSICIATDSGTVTQSMLEALYGCETVMIESNHDIGMLKNGFYPAHLKARIMSPFGHMSNSDCAKLVTYLAGGGLRRAVLAHLSENNNTPLLARAETQGALARLAPDSGVTVCNAGAGLIVEF